MPKLSDAEAITMEIVGEFMGDYDRAYGVIFVITGTTSCLTWVRFSHCATKDEKFMALKGMCCRKWSPACKGA